MMTTSLSRLVTAVTVAVCIVFVTVVPALAHPLGNFTINHYSRIVVNGADVDVHYILDYAEIPTFQEKQRLLAEPQYLDRLVETVSGQLRLTVEGEPIQLQPGAHTVQFLLGQGDLETMRIDVSLSARLPSSSQSVAEYHDGNYSDRLGWREVTVSATNGARLVSSSASDKSMSDELRTYPKDLLSAPPNVTDARFSFLPGVVSSGTTNPLPTASSSFTGTSDKLTELIRSKDISPSFLLLAAFAALIFGALHAIEPGHGKAVMAGYLVGNGGTWRQAVVLGVTITASHTAGVFVLGFITLFAADFVAPDRLYPWLTLASGVLVVGMGARLVIARVRAAGGSDEHGSEPAHHHHGLAFGHHHHHDNPHAHAAVFQSDEIHGHGHTHGQDRGDFGRPSARSPISKLSLIALGISGGLVPCPSALVVLLAAVSLHRIVLGLLLIVAFSLGLAIILTGLGVAVASGGPIIRRFSSSQFAAGVAARYVPIASAAVVTIAGLGLTAEAIPGVLK